MSDDEHRGASRDVPGRRSSPLGRQRRPISARSPLEGRQLWRIGDWGGASEQIGRRWETLGARALLTLLGVPRPGPNGAPYVPRRAVVLVDEPELAAQVHAAGKPHADAILVGQADGRTVLEPVDFKWNLETANPKQVGAEVLAGLLQDPPPMLAQRIVVALDGLPEHDDPLHHDGFFLAPDHADNRAFLSPGRAGGGRGPSRPSGMGIAPGAFDRSWAELRPVDAAEFFEPLPGWDVACSLASSDGVRPSTVEVSERYYRLGAGVLGALRKLDAGIFRDVDDLDGPAELARLRRERRLTSVGEVIAYLDRALIARGELADRLREVERTAYPFGLFRQHLVERGLPAQGPGAERRWGRVYGGVMKAVGAQMRLEGCRLVEAGRSELEALAGLDAARPRWTALAVYTLDQMLASRAAASAT